MKQRLLFFAIVMLFSACTLADEKEAAEGIAKELGAAEFTVADTTIFEKKKNTPLWCCTLKTPKWSRRRWTLFIFHLKQPITLCKALGLTKQQPTTTLLLSWI
ncbi:MAG: hypothetical protein M0D57_03395 [Sphingobacteriales bacterium JAD_PAG50586_3]|nr:MAG: hypothetical protein M0D57_03395 [Sphingobacteriales bacterium JAD_PAG50586_3]